MSTKAVAVKQALKGMLSGMAVVSTDQVQVTYGFPTRSPERRWAVVGEVQWSTTDWATNRSRQEEFTVLVAFSVQDIGGTAETAETYTISLAAEFENLLKANPSINGLCVTSGFMPRSLKSWPIDGGGFECQYETVVSAVCRP